MTYVALGTLKTIPGHTSACRKTHRPAMVDDSEGGPPAQGQGGQDTLSLKRPLPSVLAALRGGPPSPPRVLPGPAPAGPREGQAALRTAPGTLWNSDYDPQVVGEAAETQRGRATCPKAHSLPKTEQHVDLGCWDQDFLAS